MRAVGLSFTLSDATCIWEMPLFFWLSSDLCGYAKVPQLCNDMLLRPALGLSRGVVFQVGHEQPGQEKCMGATWRKGVVEAAVWRHQCQVQAWRLLTLGLHRGLGCSHMLAFRRFSRRKCHLAIPCPRRSRSAPPSAVSRLPLVNHTAFFSPILRSAATNCAQRLAVGGSNKHSGHQNRTPCPRFESRYTAPERYTGRITEGSQVLRQLQSIPEGRELEAAYKI